VKPSIFVDTDIILDLLARREPFSAAAARLFSLAEQGNVYISVSSLAYANLFYILRKEHSSAMAITILKKLSRLVIILPVDSETVVLALDAGFNDFEDALQYHTALKKGVTCLVTRNIKDFKRSTIEVCTAEEFLARRFPSAD
jgi:predicted nucleic acid-binding protein